MKPVINQPLKQGLRNLLGTLTIICVLSALAWLSQRYSLQTDITANAGNTLSTASQQLLSTLPEQIRISAFIRKSQAIRPQIAQLVDRYRRYKPDLAFTFIDPDLHPEQTKELNIGTEGMVLVEYQGRVEKLKFIDESSLTNALLQLANADERWLTFLSGHGERAPDGQANFDLSQFGKELDRRKIKAQAINLADIPAIPDNTALLVLTAPAVPFLDGELTLIKHYIDRGGNLLLLTDPDDKHLLTLEQYLGVQRVPGTIVDNGAKFYGIKDPSFVLSNTYIQHAITQGFPTITLYPVSTALTVNKDSAFKTQALLNTTNESWSETEPLTAELHFDANRNDTKGPLTFAYALTRKTRSGSEQRIVVVGDGDFLSNAYIGNVGNLDMGMRMVSWLIHDDRFIAIPAKTANDKSLHLSSVVVAVIGFGFLIALPLTLLSIGFVIWRKRKHK
ncbi:MAG: GldG family protein [Methylococcales bacterium]